MECNKDEALRAKEIAEKKMQNNDFEAARKIVLRAKNLYPELENITQLLSICDVHCSAQKGLLGSEKDWYDILQVEKMADESMVKKQYRRLALILHPDKNRFPGAEAAFKLICEANVLLSDPAKKSLYDSKIRVLTRSAPVNPPNNVNKNPQLNKQYSARANVSNRYSSLNQHQATQSASSVNQEVFWTSCPFCKTRYQYLREFVNKTLCCPTCRKLFVAYEASVHGNSSRSKSGPPGAQHVPPNLDSSQPEVVLNTGNCKMGVLNDKKGPPASHAGSQGIASKKTVRPESLKVAGAAKGTENLKTKETNIKNATNSLHREKEDGTSNGDATHRETRDLKNKSRKRVRKESSESCDLLSDSDVEDLTVKGNVGDFARRSSRKRQNVSYKETDVDDLAKRPEATKENNVEEQKDALNSEDSKNGYQNSFPTGTTAHSEESLQDNGKDAESDEKHKLRGETGGKSSNDFDTIEIESDSDEDIFSSDHSDIDCPDPEFSEFEKARDESQFDVNQFWACFDTLDGMPRFYAKVRKVFSSPFTLSITWLEAVPVEEAYKKWVHEELPVGCGSFKLGKTEKTEARLSFSHQVHFEKGKKRGSVFMYPREGEVWALFKDWDIRWSSEPDNLKEFKYEIVEVLSDFVPGFGIRVVYLDKVTGFVSLFERACQGENKSFVIRPNELYKFSHNVPCFKMTGSEREGVPIGSFELDPASLPLNPDFLYYLGKEKTENRKMDPGVQRLTPNSVEKEGKSMGSEGISTTPKKFVDLEETEKEKFVVRRSPRGQNVVIRQNAV